VRGGPLRWLQGLQTRRPPAGAFSRAVATLAGGIALTQLVTLATAPLLTRLYTPQDFGVLAVYTSIVAMWGVVSTLRYEYAVPLPKDPDTAASLLAVGGFVLGIECAVGFIVSLILGPTICRILNVPELVPWIWLLPLTVLLAGAYGLLYMWALRHKAYRRIATTKVTQGIWRAALQCGLGLLGVAPAGLLLGQAAGAAAGGTTLWRLARRTDEGAFSRVSISSARRAARRYVRFATYGSASGLLSAIGYEAIPLAFAYLFGASVAGMFGLTLRVLSMPMGLLGVAIGDAYLGVAPALLRERPAELRRLFSGLARRLLAIGILPAVVVMVAGPWLFSAVFGDTWSVAGQYARFLAPAILMEFVISPMSQTANIFERQDLQGLVNLAGIVMLTAVFVAASLFEWSAGKSVLAVSVALCVSWGLCFALYWWLLRKRRGGPEQAYETVAHT
jgi:O-antigen/teichoic acid export membrane protein